METEPLLETMRDGGAAIVTIRPAAKNAFTQADRRKSVFKGR